MRSVDAALQQIGKLKGRARDRVLRYTADEVADRLQPAAIIQESAPERNAHGPDDDVR